MKKEIKGIMPALVTPLNPDGVTLNVSALRKLIGYHNSLGADGFYIAGATGEGLVLSVDTRKKLIDESMSLIGEDKLKIVHIADMNFENTKYLARYAEAAGADAISAVPPMYFSYDADDIYNYYKQIAAEVNIPLMLYYTPAVNTVIDTKLFLRLNQIDNITSVKWTVKDYYKLIELITASEGKMKVINGPDEMLLCGLSAGCSGGIGTTYNVMLPLYKKIYELYHAGDMKGALEVQKQADKVVGVLIKYGAIQATKAVLECMGFEVGNPTFPMKAYTVEQKKQIFKEVLDAGFTY